MRSFGLTPDQILSREPAPDVGRVPSLIFSLVYGALAFGVVSVIAYAPWAFGLMRDAGPLYAVIAIVYIALIGPALSRLVVGRGVVVRFSLLLGFAFLLYAVGWCALWFGLRRTIPYSDFWGSVVGLLALTWVVCRAFEKRDKFLLLFLGLLALHTAGYYLGGYLYDALRDANSRRTSTGRLLWGVGHGAGFGAGLGYVLFHAQSALKLRLRPANPSSH
jgi:hypothetical protein